MGLFSKKTSKVDKEQKAKELYRDINKLSANAKNELDFEIAISLYELALKKYDDLLMLIDEGVNYDKDHFLSLRQSLEKEMNLLKGANDEN